MAINVSLPIGLSRGSLLRIVVGPKCRVPLGRDIAFHHLLAVFQGFRRKSLGLNNPQATIWRWMLPHRQLPCRWMISDPNIGGGRRGVLRFVIRRNNVLTTFIRSCMFDSGRSAVGGRLLKVQLPSPGALDELSSGGRVWFTSSRDD